MVAIFLIGVFTIVYEIRMWNNAEALGAQIDSGRLSLADAMKAYQRSGETQPLLVASFSGAAQPAQPLYRRGRSRASRITAKRAKARPSTRGTGGARGAH